MTIAPTLAKAHADQAPLATTAKATHELTWIDRKITR